MTGSTVFLVTLLVAPRYGLLADWFRRTSTVPQEVKEDVLGSILKAKKDWVPIAEVEQHVISPTTRIRRAIQMLERQNLLEFGDGLVKLTKEGYREARRLLRAHRIWETYLQRMGMPAEQLHQHAHILEHLNDEATIDYLDDKLGHPIQDPHGSKIPEDFVHLEADELIKSSILRDGHRATVRNVQAPNLPFSPGDKIVAGPRSSDGRTWTFTKADGTVVKLDHDQADLIEVEIDNSDELQNNSDRKQ